NGNIFFNILEGDNQQQFAVTSNGTIFTTKPLDRETQSFYSLILSATDRALPEERRLSSTVQVTIILKDVNNMSPEFVTPNKTSILENVPINTVIMAVKAIDRDEGRNSYIEYSLAPHSDRKFTLSPVDGLLRVNSSLDREIKSQYEVTVIAKDRGHPPRFASINIVIDILDENDNSPVFDPKQYSTSVSENASIGLSVLQISASDRDDGLNGQVRYSIVAGDTNHDFQLSEDTGIIHVSKNLDYERKNHYLLIVQAEDNGNDVHYDTATVTIVVTDINDNPPTFLDSPYEIHILENAQSLPTYLVTLSAYDADLLPNNRLHYLIKDGDKSLFQINSTSGEITVQKSLDREVQAEYVLTILAVDSGTPRQTGTGTVTVIVNDVNDNKPVFDKEKYMVTAMENLPVNSPVITITAVDADTGRNGLIRYSLKGEHHDIFAVDPFTGTILTKVVLDHEERDKYQVILVAQDSGMMIENSASVVVTILVGDENDNQPQFAKDSYTIYIPEMAVGGHFVFGAHAEDHDVGLNSRLVYHLSGTDADKFQINQDTGVLKLIQKMVNRSEGYHLEIHATDSGNVPLSSSINVEVFLRPLHLFPYFHPGVHNFVLQETTKDALLTTVQASSRKMGENGKITYHIGGGNVENVFSVNPNTGEVWITEGLDYEVLPKYELWIEARDSDTPPLSSVVRLDIDITDANDNAPIFAFDVYNATIIEEQSPPQFVIGVEAHDADKGENSEIIYLIQSTDATNPFTLDAKTGKIYTNMVLDRESIEIYKLIVQASDRGNPPKTGTATVLVTVLDKNDNPPRFTRLFSVNVTENAPLGTFVIQVTSSDKDIDMNANATYSFTENPGGKFHIDPVSGNVTIVGWLDREVKDEYLLKVAAVDGSWRAETPLTISIQDVNDNAPKFSNSVYGFNIAELQRAVSFVGQVTAVDQDKQGPNSVISYNLKRPSDLFRIDPASGEIMSKQTLHYKHSLHYAAPENQHILRVVATDHGQPPMSSEVDVIINIVDSNNNAPIFEKPFYFSPLPQNSGIGLSVLKVTAIDNEDTGINAEIEYNITGGNGTNFFNIHKTTGWITVANPLLGQKGQWYNLKINAVDKGVPPKSSKVNVQLVVTGENKHSPVFTALSYQVIIPENEPLHSEIVAVMATDSDSGLNGEVIYSITEGNDNQSFHIDPTSGSVTIIKPLDYEKTKEYHLNLTASDRSFKSKQATAMLTIIVTDINDNPPLFSSPIYDVYIAENEPAGTSITHLTALDIDSSRNAIVQYSIVGGSSKDMFSVGIHSGIILSKITFDYEENNLYPLEVIASNPGSNQFSSTKVNIHITSKNEFYPRFIQPVFQFTVCESAGINTAVGTLQATDEDTGPDGEIFYLLVGSSNDRGFRIEPNTGIITVARRLDRESQARVVLTVMAKNMGSIRGNDTDEAQVVVSIEDGNDPPLFMKQAYEIHTSEASPLGTSVIMVSATDKDVHPNNNHFTYSIINGNIGKAFMVDSQSGLIQTAAMLDRETIAVYNLTIAAIDTGTPPQTGTTLVKILIDDVNDNGPIFDPPDVLGYVMENEPAYTSVTVLSATDPDLPPNGAPFMYFLVGGDYKEYFEIDRHTGLVKTTQQIDREISPTIRLVVEVHDSGVPQMKSRHTITIIVMDKNDSPSSPRALTVLVWIFNNIFPGGKIAHIHPFDPDMTGQYMCNLLEGDSSVFRIPTKCDLHAIRLLNPNNYTLTVSGNDGRHPDVTSTIRVQFMTFNNKTVENSLTLKLLNHSADDFLTQQFERFQKAIGEIFKPMGTPMIYSITTLNNHLEMTMAVKMNDHSYFPVQDVLSSLQKKSNFLRGVINQDEIIFGFNPCQNLPCENGGKCHSYLDLRESLSIVDSPSLVFTSPTVIHQYSCTCAQGFSGPQCQYQEDPCAPNPCLSGGVCHHDGYDFQCLCPPQYQGKRCESVRTDLCANAPCKNGGTCEEAPNGSFFCLCRPGFRGALCEQTTDNCRPNRCLNGGTCISDKPGYRCLCEASFFGRHCEKSSYGFYPYSYMAFPALNPSTNDISIVFSTNKHNSLLVYNYGIQTGGRSDFLALEIIDGRPNFSFGGARTAIATITMTKSVADGKWHKIAVIRNGRVASVSVADCNENGETCEECFHGNTTCSMSTIGHIGTLNFHANLFYLGGVPSIEPIIERPGQIAADDFVGCVHSVAVNGRMLDLGSPVKSMHTATTCVRSELCPNVAACGQNGHCRDTWFASSCLCSSGVMAPNCNDALEPFFLGSSDSFIELLPQEKHRRVQVFANGHHQNEKWKNLPVTDKNVKSFSFMFRTKSHNGLLLYVATEDDYTILQIHEGKIVYASETESKHKVSESMEGTRVDDGNWHRVVLERGPGQRSSVNLTVDSRWKEIDSETTHDFLDAYLTSFVVGGRLENLGKSDHTFAGFQGCVKEMAVNEEIQALNSTNGYFKLIPHGNVQRGCGDEALGLDVVPTDPLSIGIILVIVFFIILIVVILVSFLVFRRRKLRREKAPGHIKQNGNAFLTGSNNDNQRTHQDGNYSESATTEDILRNHLSQDLVPKKMKDREVAADRPQRPDIIEREVLNKSSASPTHRIEDSSLQDNNKPFGMLNIADSEPPEHYDLENASSIAPSDIDIVYHYKGFRDGNVHKYKTNPHIPNYHKHNHRHSPHQFQSTPSRDSPRNVLCQSPNAIAPRESPSVLKMQNTPLARLSPSSELSQQTPRILTLQDISGKPLQTALLATSQGVGPKEFKDPLTNSERSLNSPVSHLSHSTSSIHSGPKSNSKKKNNENNITLGLTAEEIERLNARPRNSSLVSTLDAVSSSSDDNPEKNKLAELLETNTELLEAPDSSTDESGNDSFTCSEFEYDNYDKVQRDFGPGNMIFSKLAEEDNENDEDSAKTYDGFDSFRGSLSTLVASDDDLSNLSSYKPANGSMLGWDYLLNWGPNFQNLVGVFKDIAELPDTINANSTGHSKPGEEYV
ncbi:cadherin-related tumor suppressor-like, partial [Centruroides sculpturatus]|uniref:cadherin-related tumor suppressor-like n=1 Tax=Centruroides sculpturatus TaxID=218467 RepID=UPI000C6E3628